MLRLRLRGAIGAMTENIKDEAVWTGIPTTTNSRKSWPEVGEGSLYNNHGSLC